MAVKPIRLVPYCSLCSTKTSFLIDGNPTAGLIFQRMDGAKMIAA